MFSIFARWIWISINEILIMCFGLLHKNYDDNQSYKMKWRSPHICSYYWEFHFIFLFSLFKILTVCKENTFFISFYILFFLKKQHKDETKHPNTHTHTFFFFISFSLHFSNKPQLTHTLSFFHYILQIIIKNTIQIQINT